MLAQKPYEKSPYEVFKELKAPWLGELRQNVTNVIDAYYAWIRDEAQLDGVPRLVDEDFLYERFVDNVACNLYYSNWEVLKYFIVIMRIKMYKEFIGEWTFTEHDVEMYNHFNYMDVNDDNKCTYRQLKFHSNLGVNEYELLDKEMSDSEGVGFRQLYSFGCDGYSPFGIPYKYYYYAMGSITYRQIDKTEIKEEYWDCRTSQLLDHKKQMLEEMIRHCKLCAPIFNDASDKHNYFKTEQQWYSGNLGYFNQLKNVCLHLSNEQKRHAPRSHLYKNRGC